MSWLRRDGASPDDFFLVGHASSGPVADLEFYRDGDNGSLRFDLAGPDADFDGYKSVLEAALPRITGDVQTVVTSAVASLVVKCRAIEGAGFRPDGRTSLMALPVHSLGFSDAVALLPLDIIPYDRSGLQSGFADLHNAVFRDIPGARTFDAAMMADLVNENLAHGQFIHFALCGDKPIGWIWGGIETEDGVRDLFIESIGVLAPFRRRGVASALIASVLCDNFHHDIAKVLASVDERNIGSRRFFDTLGFKMVETTKWYKRRTL